jgi:hypothetical protein
MVAVTRNATARANAAAAQADIDSVIEQSLRCTTQASGGDSEGEGDGGSLLAPSANHPGPSAVSGAAPRRSAAATAAAAASAAAAAAASPTPPPSFSLDEVMEHTFMSGVKAAEKIVPMAYAQGVRFEALRFIEAREHDVTALTEKFAKLEQVSDWDEHRLHFTANVRMLRDKDN